MSATVALRVSHSAARRRAHVEVSLPVVQVDEFGIRRVVADDDVEIAIAIEVDETPRSTIESDAEVPRS
jgi:RNA polymerase-interacting CarD/CdnL/TRCF family regulator